MNVRHMQALAIVQSKAVVLLLLIHCLSMLPLIVRPLCLEVYNVLSGLQLYRWSFTETASVFKLSF